ncbi:hypothetical protein [Kingella denitrificans]|jgi:hypothetical protein|uniref:Uncharacterized protein n=1 Tax=Kingella denitrificans ATCC 33394 TaxID=888741 RepID=F0F073_9NEIS|nr:hypothetical protein [Kingella denitrificans]EGC17107.1 hypothetical protein HMPREF9098_1507 [Kingella denitrificans ATCC 33394]QQB42054.1 hypothetical protein I6I17_00215 [Kingella denitrificans]RKW30768.1 MAG: hypothetical protein D8B47_00300 [Kingella sp. (in: b-proteobacteria)]STR12052.1 Uncharacterised protein [Kingella denitrificans]
MAQPEMPKWFGDDGSPVSCTEKIKVMSQNMDELFQAAQDAFEDALLMGCSEAQVREYLQQLVRGVENPYR